MCRNCGGCDFNYVQPPPLTAVRLVFNQHCENTEFAGLTFLSSGNSGRIIDPGGFCEFTIFLNKHGVCKGNSTFRKGCARLKRIYQLFD